MINAKGTQYPHPAPGSHLPAEGTAPPFAVALRERAVA